MNIFILNNDPVLAAQEQCDKHVVKMIVESGQMLSTAHRMIDGTVERRPSKSGKTMMIEKMCYTKHVILIILVLYGQENQFTITNGTMNTFVHCVTNTRIDMVKHI